MADVAAESLLSELTLVVSALSESQQAFVGRLQRFRTDGFGSVPSAAGFVPPPPPPPPPQTIQPEPTSMVIDVVQQQEAPVSERELDKSEKAVTWPTSALRGPPRQSVAGRDYDYFSELDAQLARLNEQSPSTN